MTAPRTGSIKRSQKESQLFREISQLYLQASLEEPRIGGLLLNRVELSRDGGICTAFFYTPDGMEAFKEKLSYLKLFKPSMRKALAERLAGRYVPDLIFRFDDKFEKQLELEQKIDLVARELSRKEED